MTEEPPVLIDQKLEAFFVDKKPDTNEVVNIILVFEKNQLVIGWDKEKDTFKFSISR